MSHVNCHMSFIFCLLIRFKYFCYFFGQNCGASWWRVCYQRDLPRLVYKIQDTRLPCERKEQNLYHVTHRNRKLTVTSVQSHN